MATDNENGVALVRRGYDESTRCLSFRVIFSTYSDGPACALAALRAIGGYNAFDGADVARAIEPLLAADDIVRFPGIAVGREYSPVLYLTIRPDVADGTRDVIVGALREVGADELDWEGDTLRAWWD